MDDKGELRALLDEISTLKEDLNRVRADITRIEKRVKELLEEGEGEQTEQEFDVFLAISFSEENITVRSIINELEREDGYAELDKIIQRAAEAGIDKEKTERAIDNLMQNEYIFEPVKRSQKYRRMER